MKDSSEQQDGYQPLSFGGWDSLHEIESDLQLLLRDIKKQQKWIKDKRITDADKVRKKGAHYLEYIETKVEWLEDKLFRYGHWANAFPQSVQRVTEKKFLTKEEYESKYLDHRKLPKNQHVVRTCQICSDPLWKTYRKQVSDKKRASDTYFS